MSSAGRSGKLKKRVDPRIKALVEEGVRLNHRSMFVLVGKRGKSQIVNLHWMLQRCHTSSKSPHARSAMPSVLWCYNKELGFSPNHVKQVQKIKSQIRKGLRRADMDDPFEAFVLNTSLRYVRFKDSERVLGQTFELLVLQDFESITPNLLARTVETVRGGGLIVVLLDKISHLKQLFTLAMDVHKRFRTPSHQIIVPRFNERFTLSLADCNNCLIIDDELSVMPVTSAAQRLVRAGEEEQKSITSAHGKASAKQILQKQERERESLEELKATLKDTKPIGDILGCSKTCDQAKAVMVFLEAIADKTLSSTVVLTAARGRGKSAALGLAVAGAIALQYANIFVTSPTPENLRTLFEIMLVAFDALGLKEHTDYEVIQSTNPEFHRAVVRVNVFKKHRQTIQYVSPQDYAKLAQAELLVIDEAAAIPLPLVKKLIGPYLVFLSSTVNGYEGTGRSLSLKLVKQLRTQAVAAHKKAKRGKASAISASAHARTLRELQLNEPIRYGIFDGVETWLTDLLCLNCCSGLDAGDDAAMASFSSGLPSALSSVSSALSLKLTYHPSPHKCELFAVNRDTLFSYNRVSEYFLQKMMSLYVSSHYKNQPNDLQLMSDAPSHQLFVLLAPRAEERSQKLKAGVSVDAVQLQIPDILAVIQVSLEGQLTKRIIREALAQGKRLSGDMIPWIMSQQFQDDDFGRLSGARVVRIAVHPHIQSMGYGSRALQLLVQYYRGLLIDISAMDDTTAAVDEDGDSESESESEEVSPKKRRKLNSGESEKKKKKKRKKEKRKKSKSKSKKKKKKGSSKKSESEEESKESEEVKVRSKLPPLLTPVSEMKPHKLHWIGVAFGLTAPLFKFWKKAEFQPVYIRQTPNEVTGEHTTVMIRPLQSADTANDVEWIHSFSKDFCKRFSHLLSFDFRHLDVATALWVLNPNPALLTSDSGTRLPAETDATRTLLTYAALQRVVSDWDLKRLDKYCRSLFDHRLVLDLMPALTRLFFDGALDIELNFHQCAILAAVGFQRKSLEEISKQMDLRLSQTTSLLNKALRKVHAYLESVIETHVRTKVVEPQYAEASGSRSAKRIAAASDPVSGLSDELRREGLKKERAEKRKLLSEQKSEAFLSKSDRLEHDKRRTRERARTLAHLKEYNVSDLKLDASVLGTQGEVPDSIVMKVGERAIDMPKTQILATVDPSSFRKFEQLRAGKLKIKGHKKRDSKKKAKKRKRE